MRIIDSHFHWWPRSVFEFLCARQQYPRAAVNSRGGYTYWRKEGDQPLFDLGPEWFELDAQLAHMDKLERAAGLLEPIGVVCSIGPLSIGFSDLPAEAGREMAMLWNQAMADAQKLYSTRLWASAAVPLLDTEVALEVLEHAITELGLMGVNLPGSVGDDPRIDAPRLEPFYNRVTELDVPLFLHPTDAVFSDMLEGYGGALHLSLGRVIEVSVAASRLIFSGMMERHPTMKVVMSHTGGALPYQSGRMDKNGKAAKLPHPPSTYIRRMYTDTVSPHMAGIRFAIEYYGADHVMYGSDYPCWSPADALRLFDEIGLSESEQEAILGGNARRILNLRDTAGVASAAPSRGSVAA